MSWLKVILFLASFVAFLSWAGGQRAFATTVGAFRFLLTRPAVLIAWAIGSVLMGWLMVDGARENGRDVMALMPMTIGISLFCGLGFAALVVPPFFFLMRMRTPHPSFAVPPDEEVLWTGPMNHLLQGESRAGVGFVTREGIYFHPGRFNVQLAPWSLRRDALVHGEVVGGRLCVLTDAQKEEHLIVIENPQALVERLFPQAGSNKVH
jgi:hypothetical protein